MHIRKHKHTHKIVMLLGLGTLGMVVACNMAEVGGEAEDGERSPTAFNRYCRTYRVSPCFPTGKFNSKNTPIWKYAVDKLCWNESTGLVCYKGGDETHEGAFADRLTCKNSTQAAGDHTQYWSWDTKFWTVQKCPIGSTWFADDNSAQPGPSNPSNGSNNGCPPCEGVGQAGVCMGNTVVLCENGCRKELTCPPDRPCRQPDGKAQCVPEGDGGSVGGPCFSDSGHQGTCKQVSQCHGKVWVLDNKCDDGSGIKCCIVLP